MESFPKRFLLWFVILFIAIVLLIGTFYFDNSRIILKNQYIESFDSSIGQLDNSIAEFISSFESALDMFSQNEMIQNVSDNPDKYFLSSRQLFKSFQESYPSTAFAYFAPNTVFNNKKLVTWPDTSSELESQDWVANQRPWYINAVNANGQIAWSKPYLDSTTQKPIITISKIVVNSNQEFKGVIAIDFFLDELSNKIENFKAFKQGYAFLIDKDKDDYVFITKDINHKKFYNMLDSKWIDKLYEKKSGSFYISDSDINYYITFTTNKLTGWKVLGIIEEEKIYKNTTNMMKEIFTSGILIILIGLVCIAYISNQLTKSILDLNTFLHKSENDSNPSLDSNNDLSDKFNLILSENDDEPNNYSNSYINLLFETEYEIEKILDIIDNKLEPPIDISILNELSNALDKLIYFRTEFNDSSSKIHQIQKDNIDNHIVLLLNKIKTITRNPNSEVDLVLTSIYNKIISENKTSQ